MLSQIGMQMAGVRNSNPFHEAQPRPQSLQKEMSPPVWTGPQSIRMMMHLKQRPRRWVSPVPWWIQRDWKVVMTLAVVTLSLQGVTSERSGFH